MVRYYYVFKGQVQGVGFRWAMQMQAQRYGLTGWITNLYNGDVEMQIQGEREMIHKCIEAVQKNSRFIIIEDYAVKEIPLVEKDKRFQVR